MHIGLEDHKKLGNKELSLKWFSEASNYLTTYYGQLAYRTDPNATFELSKDIKVKKEYRIIFKKRNR